VTTDRRYVMFEAFADEGGYPNYREIVARARRAEITAGHSWGRQTEA